MNNVLELSLTGVGAIPRESFVKFNTPTISSTVIAYNVESGIITFNEPGQYSIKWWVATETTLKGPIGFTLKSSEASFVSGCSPIKTGQVTGFGVIDVQTLPSTLSLQNLSLNDTILSRKTGTKAYMLISPITQSPTRVYRGDLSTPGSVIQVPLGNGLYYRLENLNSTEARLVFSPMNGSTRYDYRRFCSYDGIIAFEGNYADNSTLSGVLPRDSPIYNASREMHWVLVRVENPVTKLWSTYEVRFFLSGGLTRATVWVNVIEEEVSY